MNQNYGIHCRTIVSPGSPIIFLSDALSWDGHLGIFAIEGSKTKGCSHDSLCAAWNDRTESIEIVLEIEVDTSFSGHFKVDLIIDVACSVTTIFES
jgi:hypothetical protein